MKVSLAGVVVAAGLLVAMPASAGRASYVDGAGEDAVAPDIRTVVVERAGEAVLFRIEVPNMPEALAADALLFVVIDADRNAATGDPSGGEYVVIVDGSDRSFGFYRWNGSALESFPHGPVRVSWSGGAHLSLPAADLGGGEAFDFFIVGLRGGDADRHLDFAPDNGSWAFSASPQAPRLSIDRMLAVPSSPRAGQPFVIGGLVTATDAAGSLPVTSGRVSCRAKVGGKRVVATARPIALGLAQCVVSIPRDAGGKRLVGVLTVVAQGATVSRPFSYRVR